MKFGKRLRKLIRPEFGDYYVDYKSLKKTLKAALGDAHPVRHARFVSFLRSPYLALVVSFARFCGYLVLQCVFISLANVLIELKSLLQLAFRQH